ncbi:hypothetical protein DIE11_20045 [Burkholderia sp. Bp9012]|nr:hypothetical protein DIE11_20045 [Burkholderia sp. Bp9012]
MSAIESQPDLILHDGRFTTLDRANPSATAVAITAGRFVAMFVANDFWNRSGAEHFMALNSFFEHLGLIAALVLETVLADARQPAGDGLG